MTAGRWLAISGTDIVLPGAIGDAAKENNPIGR